MHLCTYQEQLEERRTFAFLFLFAFLISSLPYKTEHYYFITHSLIIFLLKQVFHFSKLFFNTLQIKNVTLQIKPSLHHILVFWKNLFSEHFCSSTWNKTTNSICFWSSNIIYRKLKSADYADVSIGCWNCLRFEICSLCHYLHIVFFMHFRIIVLPIFSENHESFFTLHFCSNIFLVKNF